MLPIRSVPESPVDTSKPRVSITSAKDSSFETQCVLATCQSLALLDGEVVGDPLEKACLNAINWNLNKGQCRVL